MDVFGARRVPFLARRNYRHEMQHILAWGVPVGLVEGNFAAVVVAKTFGGGDVLIDIAATTPVAMNFASLFWGTLAVGRPKLRLFTIAAAGLVILTAGVGAIPANRTGAWLFVAQMAAAQFFLSGVVTLRSGLWKHNYPARSRGSITARVQVARYITRMAAVAAAASLFDLNPTTYRWAYPVMAMIGVLGIALLQRTHVRGERSELARVHRAANGTGGMPGLTRPVPWMKALSPAFVLSGAFRVLREDRRFRGYMVAQMFGGFANLLVRSVLVVVLMKSLLVVMDREYWISSVLLELLPTLVLLYSIGKFAKYFDRVGVIRFRVVQSVWWIAAISLGTAGTLATVYAERIGPYYVVVAVSLFSLFSIARGLCDSGGSLAWNLGHLHFARSEDAEAYMGIHVSLTGLRGLVMPTLGILLWNTIGWWVWMVSIGFGVLALVCFANLEREERVAERFGESLSGIEAQTVAIGAESVERGACER